MELFKPLSHRGCSFERVRLKEKKTVFNKEAHGA